MVRMAVVVGMHIDMTVQLLWLHSMSVGTHAAILFISYSTEYTMRWACGLQKTEMVFLLVNV